VSGLAQSRQQKEVFMLPPGQRAATIADADVRASA
jgi:hypothetical protein